MAGARIRLGDWGWRHAGRERWALRGLDLVIEPGERVLLLGASGAGKSTLLHAMAGLTGPDSAIDGEEEGTLLVDDAPARERRGAVGLVSQDPETQLVMARAGDDVAFGLENLAVRPEHIWPRADAAMAEVGFPYARRRSTAALSGGEKQRLVIAGALALRPRLLLLDEPTANLDPPGAGLVRALLADLADTTQATLVLVEHRVADAVDLVDRVIVLEAGGGVLADGAPDEVFAAQGAELSAQGVWVPGREPKIAAQPAEPGETVIEAVDCAVRAPAELGVRAGAAPMVLRGAGAAAPAGCATALTGANGSGKSTLLMMLAGLTKPDKGAVHPRGSLAAVDRRPLHRWPARRLARHIGTVFQHAEDQFVTASVREELSFAPLRSGMGERGVRSWVDELLGRLHLTHLADVHPFTLSGGEKRRLSVATALSPGPDHAPEALLLDEPTFGQDTRTWTELVELLAALRSQGSAIVMATHDDLLLRDFADARLKLSGGAVESVGARGGARPDGGDAGGTGDAGEAGDTGGTP